MKIKSDTAHELWITFLDGRQINLDPDSLIEISDSGLLVIKHSNHQVTIYPPNSWVKVKLVNPVVQLASSMLCNGLGVSIPSP
jgi:hypothetical protein